MQWLPLIFFLVVMPKAGWASSTYRHVCLANLMQINGAVQQWALENRLTDTNSYSLRDTNVTQYMPHGKLPECPAGGVYVAGKTVNDLPHCTFHGGLDNESVWENQQKRIENALFLAVWALVVVTVLFGLLVFNLSNEAMRSSSFPKAKVLAIRPVIMFSFALLISQTRFLVVEQYRWSFSFFGPMQISALIGFVMAVAGIRKSKGALKRYLWIPALLNFALISPLVLAFFSSLLPGSVNRR